MNRNLKNAIVKVMTVTRAYRILEPYFQGDGAILMFHRVCPSQPDKQRMSSTTSLEVSPEYLEAIIVCLKKLNYDIISLDQLHERLMSNFSTKPFVCFTFDDGYIETYEIAYPILKKHNIPFAIYVTNSFPDETAILWWYALEDLLLQSEKVKFEYNNHKYSYQSKSPEQKTDAFNAIRSVILIQPQYEVANFMETLLEDSDISIENYRSLAMTWNQVVELSSDPLVTIGVHTVNHLNLRQLSEDEVEQEITTSKQEIEAKIGKVADHFSYPYGSPDEASRREFDIVKRCNFKTGTTTRQASVFSEHKAYMECLPRLNIYGNYQDISFFKMMLAGFSALYSNGLQRVVTE